ncbi:MAG: DUF1080 domain-containing protein [FCB group bacterium]|jgi:lysophospholipase L1-like esterase|nr:DUF1080 domain-containing protein [FCB group bacterium]
MRPTSFWTRCVLGSIAALWIVAAVPAFAASTATVPVPRDQEEWWVQRHNAAVERIKQGNVDLLMIGDSITHGWEGAGKATWDKYYGDRNAVNIGYSGDQTQHVLWRFENGELDGISPKLAVLMIGTNNFMANTAEEIGEGIQAVVAKLRQKLPTTKVLILAIFPREEKPGETRDKLAKASEIASKAADGKDVFFLDIAPFFLAPDGTLPKDIMPDFLHPNEKGYALWAAAVEPKIAELMGERAAGKAPKGFEEAFNGKDLTGWKGLAEENPEKRNAMTPEVMAAAQAKGDEDMRAHWSVVDGVLSFDGKGQSISTGRDYQDFDMLVDWKIDSKGDSGIYTRGYPQVQIWDTAMWPQGSGGLYNNEHNPKDPLMVGDNPINTWNTFRIIMINDRVTVYLNDKLVVNNTQLENYWSRGNPILDCGPIYLQNHGNHLWFDNIYIREIPRGEGWVDLFNGKDLTGWEQVGGSRQAWKAENGILSTTPGEGGGWLSTAKEYSDFELEAEFRVPENGNSGIFIRAPREGNPAFEGSEIQVLDDAGPIYPAMNLQPYQYCGSIYSTVAPERRVSRPAGEWQKMQIRAEGPMVSVTLNGWPIIKNANLNDYPDKVKDHPGLKRASGFIGLQNHESSLDYRNIRIRELPAAAK